jgi:hypothetical protein
VGNRLLITETSKIAYLVASDAFIVGLNKEKINHLFEESKKANSLNFEDIVIEDNHYVWYLANAKWFFNNPEAPEKISYQEYASKYAAPEDALLRSVINIYDKQNSPFNFRIMKINDPGFYRTLLMLLETSEYIDKGFTWKEEDLGDDINFVLYRKQIGFLNKLLFSSDSIKLVGVMRYSEIESIETREGKYFEIKTRNKSYLISLVKKL